MIYIEYTYIQRNQTISLHQAKIVMRIPFCHKMPIARSKLLSFVFTYLSGILKISKVKKGHICNVYSLNRCKELEGTRQKMYSVLTSLWMLALGNHIAIVRTRKVNYNKIFYSLCFNENFNIPSQKRDKLKNVINLTSK